MELHPLCTFFPRMSGYEFDCLKLDIQENGQIDPIMIYDGMILDGGNRYRACVELGKEPVTAQFEGDNIAAYVLSVNLHRRHMTPGQQAAIVAAVQDWGKAQAVGKPKSGKITELDTVADRMKLSGVSDKTQRNADKVAKADPKLAAAVGRGEISLPKATEQITGKKPATVKPSPEPELDEKQILIDSLNTLIEDLYDQLAEARNAAASGGSAEHKARFDELTAENKKLLSQVKALTRSRDTYMNENAALKRQCQAQQAKIKRLEK